MRTRKLVLFSSVILVAGSLHAQLPRIILQSGGIPQVFTTVNEALTAAQPNDKLYFSGGTILEAAGITIDKPLHFIGAGISPDTANVTGVTTLSTGGSTRITILTEAGGSTFTGINFNPGGNIQYGTDPNDDDPKDLIVSTRWRDVDAPHIVGTTADVGEAFLGRYLLPFEVISVLLLAAVVGAVVIARRDSRSEREIGERRR